jgi:hypothetical protein
MKSIEFYFEKYLSDKGENGYSNVYNDVFGPRRYDPIKLLEIGIGTLSPAHSNMLFWKDRHSEYQPGASLRAFRDYFPNGWICGIDIQADCMIEGEWPIITILVNSTDKIACDEYFNNILFDFIIDDGDHNYLSQIKTFENFFGKISKNGVYLLEDLESPDELVKYFSSTKFNWEMRDKMIIIRK